MSNTNPEIEEIRKKLEEPFSAMDIKFRIRKKNLKYNKVEVLAYIDSRAVHKRLSDSVGFGNWKMDYRVESLHDHMRDPNKVTKNWDTKLIEKTPVDVERRFNATICRLSLKLGNRWIHREGMSGITDIEPVKGSASGAEKRAAVPFGIGAYLYETDSIDAKVFIGKDAPDKYGWKREYDYEKKTWWWEIPTLPNWLRSESEKEVNNSKNVLALQNLVPEDKKIQFYTELVNMYSPDYSTLTIVACRGNEIIKKLENKEFAFQQEVKNA